MERKKKAWIVTACLLLILSIWALVAVHDAAVASARAARAGSAPAQGKCPFGDGKPVTQEAMKKPCCNSKRGVSDKPVAAMNSTATPVFDPEALDNLNNDQLEELKKQFSPEQLEKCPHLKARKSKRKQ